MIIFSLVCFLWEGQHAQSFSSKVYSDGTCWLRSYLKSAPIAIKVDSSRTQLMSALVAQADFNGHVYTPPRWQKLSHLFKWLYFLSLWLVLCMQDNMPKITYLCTSLSDYLPVELHFANYSLGMMTNRHWLWSIKLCGYCHNVSWTNY
jgi:hypothetical protein